MSSIVVVVCVVVAAFNAVARLQMVGLTQAQCGREQEEQGDKDESERVSETTTFWCSGHASVVPATDDPGGEQQTTAT